MLSQEQLDAVFAHKASKRQAKGKGKAFVRIEGKLEHTTIRKMGDFDFGQHHGKVGSIRRSNKGASRRMPNGSRYYVAHDYDRDKPEVVAYKLRSS